MRFERALAAVGVFALASYAPARETARPLPVEPIAQMNMVSEDVASDAPLDPTPTGQGRYGCRSRSLHGEPLYFAIPNRDEVPIDCLQGTVYLISRTIGDTSPPPEGR